MKRFLTIMLFSFVVVAAFATTGSAEDKGNAADGKASYDTYCVACHGASGKGDGAAAAALDPKPRDLTDAAYVSTLSNEHLFKVIKEGGPSVGLAPTMAAWGGALSDQDISNVIAFIRQDVCKCQYDGK